MKLINTTCVSEFLSILIRKKLITFEESAYLRQLARMESEDKVIYHLTELRKDVRRNHEWDDRRTDVVIKDAITHLEEDLNYGS